MYSHKENSKRENNINTHLNRKNENYKEKPVNTREKKIRDDAFHLSNFVFYRFKECIVCKQKTNLEYKC
jgi:hypothetical protein